jgi:hypothetical protein
MRGAKLFSFTSDSHRPPLQGNTYTRIAAGPG